MATIVAGTGLPLLSVVGGSNSRCDNWTIEDSERETFIGSVGPSGTQLVPAKCFDLTVGFSGNACGGALSTFS